MRATPHLRGSVSLRNFLAMTFAKGLKCNYLKFIFVDSSIINKIRRIINKAKLALVNFYWLCRRHFSGTKFKNDLIKNGKQQIDPVRNMLRNLLRLGKNITPPRNGISNKVDLDKKLVCSLSQTRWPNCAQLKYIKRYLNVWELRVVYSCLWLILISSLFLGTRFYLNHLQDLPASGGEYSEGVVGAPKYINPLYASVNDVDSDITSLVFSSLFKRGASGELINDLAESYAISPDGKNYTIKIKTGVNWHNSGSLTAADIIFTFNAIKDAQYKSPLRTSFSGVEIAAVDDQTIKFILAEPYAAFLDLLIFGILPQESWQQVSPSAASLAELNLKPIGSGPYKFKSLVKDKSGNIRSYTLSKNENYYGPMPYIDKITFKFFASFEELTAALNNNLVNGISYLPDQFKNEIVAKDSLNFYQLSLPQLAIIFFNPKINAALANKKVRQALAYALDKNQIISQAKEQNARLIDGPIISASFAYNASIKKYNYDIASANKLLDEAGWKAVTITEADIDQAKVEVNSADEAVRKKAEAKVLLGAGEWRAKGNDYFIIELITVEMPEYAKAAEIAAKFWQDIKVRTIVNLIPVNKIQSEVIRQRNFSTLLYSELVGADPDPYAFWHSSQISQAGLNIADYANKEVDKLLEDARLSNDKNVRREKYIKFQEIIAEEVPAIFLYSPNYTYVQAKKVKGFTVKNIFMPYNRLADINNWYIKTGKRLVW